MTVSAIIKEYSRIIPVKEALEVEVEFTQGLWRGKERRTLSQIHLLVNNNNRI